MATPSVWIVNKGSHPYHRADKFGQLRVLTEGRVNVFSIDNLTADICNKLVASAGPDDLLLISGYAIPNGIAISWFLKKFGRARMLVWGATRQEYTALTLNNDLLVTE